MNGKERFKKIKDICDNCNSCYDCVIGCKVCSYIFGDKTLPNELSDDEGGKYDLIDDYE